MKNVLLTACYCVFQCALAQPVITLEHAPQPGDQCSYGLANQPFEIPEQPGWILDLSGFTFEPSPYSYIYVELASTPGSSLFPDADLAEFSSGGGHTYFDMGPAGIQVLGYQAGALYSIMTDPLLLMVYPCSVGVSWSDAYAYSGTWDTDSGTVTWEAFTHGVIGLNGGYLPVLALRNEYSQTNVVEGSTWEFHTTDLRFFSPLTRCQLGDGHITQVFLDGSYHDTFHSLSMLLNPDLAADDVTTSSQAFRVWPVPASNMLEFDRDPDDREVAVFDAAGRIIQSTSLSQGDPVGRLPVEDLVTGHYTLKITSTSGGSKHARFVVE